MSRLKLILTCKQVSRTLLEEHYRQLSWHRKLAVRFHLSWCWICGKFNQQVIDMQNGIDQYIDRELEDPVPSNMQLPDDTRERVLKAMRDNQQ